jgi:hydrogenase maturation protein HypF
MIASGRHMTWTTSAGRLFDGVAALLFLSNRPTYEGEWAMRLEAFCDRMDPHSYRFSIQDVPTLHQDSIAIEMDWRPLVRGLVHDLRSGTEGSAIAMRFHRGLATAIAEVADRFPGRKMVLSGGVFQNRVLVELLEDLLRERDRTIGWCAKIPSNDGGLAMGQLVAALRSVPDCHRHSKGDQACV